MDYFQATEVVYGRIQQLEPEYVAKKIIGHIFLQAYPNREMIRLAFGPDSLIHNLIKKTKIELGLVSKQVISPSLTVAPIQDFPAQFATISPTALSSPAAIRLPAPYWDQLIVEQPMPNDTDCMSSAYSDYPSEDYGFSNQHIFPGSDGQLEPFSPERYGFPGNYYEGEATFPNLTSRRNLNSSNLSEFPIKACHYFNKGYCKHGSNCRYFHGQSLPGGYYHTFGTNESEDSIFSPGSLEKIEMEIVGLLKLRRGPVSIAYLPLLYFEKYGKVIQADGYLTESQRHGKAGYSLTKLLTQLNSITLIDRPHGKHSVILAEDAPKYAEIRSERNDPGPIVCGSRQIYLTFPADSTFSEGDVASYFNTFGPVEDVRIPYQQKRMFGFVTFVSAYTVKMILSKGNPHYVCGARVLVKPYREKMKLIDWKFSEKVEPPIYYHSCQIETDCEIHERWESSRLLRKQLVEEHECALDLERMHLSDLQLTRNPLANQSDFHCSVEELQVSGQSKFLSEESFHSILPDILNDDSLCDANTNNSGSKYTEHESQALDIPDSPFASLVASGISTAI